MRALLQRVAGASVTADGILSGRINAGLVVFLGVAPEDDESDIGYMTEKIAFLRIFRDSQGRMNKSVVEIGGAILLVSQFTLYASTRKGRRPYFGLGADPEKAEALYNTVVDHLSRIVPVETGVFGAAMSVELINDGPVTIMIDSRNRE